MNDPYQPMKKTKPLEEPLAASAADELRLHTRETQHLMAMAVIAGLTLGVLAYAAFEVILWRLRETAGPAGGPAVAQPYSSEPRCRLGDPCGDPGSCTCVGPLECREGICENPMKSAHRCDDPQIKGLLQDLGRVCSHDVCEGPEFDEFILDTAKFGLVITNFPGAVSVHFEAGTPKPGTWLTDARKTYYQTTLTSPENLDTLREASQILLIARSSPGGSADANKRMANKRVVEVKKALLSAVAYSEKDLLESKMKFSILGDKNPLSVADFPRESVRVVAWDEASERKLRRDLDVPSGTPQQDLADLLNQVVFVIPLTCDLPAPKTP